MVSRRGVFGVSKFADRKRWGIGGAAIFMVVTLIATGGAQILPVAPALAAPECPKAAPNETAAIAAAAACGGRVEVMDRRTETSRALVSGDGSATTEHYALPRWARSTSGTWVDIDTNLRVAAGVITPVAAALPVSFSNGGDGPLATIMDGTRSVSLSWPGRKLPKPTLEGDTATYPEVLGGVDLRLTALPSGFSEVLVVKSAEAAKNPALARLRFGLAAKGVTITQTADGGLVATGAGGEPVFTSPRATMWDSSGESATSGGETKSKTKVQSDGAGGDPVKGHTAKRVVPMGEELSGGDLTVVPDQAFLTDSATRYPVYIDPPWSGGKTGYAVVANRPDLADSRFWNTTFLYDANILGGAGAGLTCDSYSGNECYSPKYAVRSMFAMETYGAAGATVKSANFEITQRWAWTCTPVSNAKAWVTGGISASTSWSNQPGWDGGHYALAAGRFAVGAPAGCSDVGTVSFNATDMVRYGFSVGSGNLTIGLRAENEGTVLQWKRFDAGSAVLRIDYDHVPNTPTLADLRMGPSAQVSCGISAAVPARLNTTNGLTLHATLSDPDAPKGDLVRAEWSVSGIDSRYAPPAEQAALESGKNHQVTIPAAAFTEGAAVSWRVRGIDTDSNYAGAWSPECHLSVDNTVPRAPQVASVDLALRLGLGIVPGPSERSVVGQPAIVTVAPDPSDDSAIVGYRYGVAADADAVPTIWAPARSDGSMIASVVPLAALSFNVIAVAAVKTDGTVGEATTARFSAHPATGAPRVPGDATGDGRADVTVFGDVGDGKNALWRWNATPDGGLGSVLAPQGNAGIFPAGSLGASGDFDADGKSDVATLTQSGSNALLAVQRSDGNQLLSSPTLRTLSGWTVSKVKLVAGDFDGDGRDDLTAMYDTGGSSWEMRVMLSTATGGTLGFTEPAVWLAAPAGYSDWSRIKLVPGDFNADGKDDIGEFYGYDGDRTRLFVHSSSGTSLTEGVVRWDSGAGSFNWSRAKFAAGDFTGDGRADITALYGYDYARVSLWTIVAQPDGSMGAISTWWGISEGWSWDWGVTDPVTGDFTGDGKADVSLVYRGWGPFQARVWALTTNSAGTGFTLLGQQWNGVLGPVGAGGLPADDPNQRYQFVNVNSDKCLTVPGGSTGDDVQVQQSPCSDTNLAGQFTLQVMGGGQYWIKPAHVASKCLGIPGGPLEDGAGFDQYGCGAQWENLKIQFESGGSAGDPAIVTIRPMYSGKCVDVPNGSKADGVGIQQYTCNSSVAQLFAMRPVG